MTTESQDKGVEKIGWETWQSLTPEGKADYFQKRVPIDNERKRKLVRILKDHSTHPSTTKTP